jgi:hypothetical protein
MGIPLSQMPISLIEQIANRLHPFTTVIVKLQRDQAGNKKPPVQIGSGTFIAIGNVYGILTAQHVARELDGDCALGLALLKHEHIHLIERQYLDVIHVASAIVPADGPDLAFIVLPAPNVSAIKAVKSFYNLSAEKEQVLSRPLPLDWGIWFLCGAPGEKTAKEESAIAYDGVFSFGGMCYAAGADREFQKDGFDYIELGVEYKDGADLPSTFGGMSGGGLWQVPLRQAENGMLEPSTLLLSGVIFYEFRIDNQPSIIKCHGRRSIYQNVYDAVKMKYPNTV